MDKLPIELFIDRQLKQPRYQTIIAQLGVDPLVVRLALVAYLKAQGVHLVTPTLGSELSERLACELEQNSGVARYLGSAAKK